jgi:hypothetical protein
MAIINKMWIYSDKIKDITIIKKIIQLLMLKFNFVMCSIKKAKDVDELFIYKFAKFLTNSWIKVESLR